MNCYDDGELTEPDDHDCMTLTAENDSMGLLERWLVVRSIGSCRASGAQISYEVWRSGTLSWGIRITGFGTRWQLMKLMLQLGIYEEY